MFENTLIIGITTRALFNLEKENSIFVNQGKDVFRRYQQDNESQILDKGTAFHVIEALLKLNELSDSRLVEVIIMSKNSPETAIRVLSSIEHYKLDITRSAFTGGEPLVTYMQAFKVDLFLSRDEEDVQNVIDSKVASAALIYDPPQNYVPDKNIVRIAFDADAVLFSDESELIYKTKGLKAFQENEHNKLLIPLSDGPHARFLRKLSSVQKQIGEKTENSPLKIAIVTARNSPAHFRVLNTLRHWDVYIDAIFFLGGIPKDQILEAFKAQIFFDDQDTHLQPASILVPSGKVPYRSNSELQLIDLKTVTLKRVNDLKALKERMK